MVSQDASLPVPKRKFGLLTALRTGPLTDGQTALSNRERIMREQFWRVAGLPCGSKISVLSERSRRNEPPVALEGPLKKLEE